MIFTVRASAVAAIISLFFSCGPSAVSGLVMSVHVDSVKRVAFRWALSHVGQERLKAIPATTDSDASACPLLAILASASHAAPRAPSVAACLSMLSEALVVFSQELGQKAAATLNNAAPNSTSVYDFFGPTVTPKQILSVPVDLTGERDNSEPGVSRA